ncbi:hypothetical protein LNKW23_45610 [Paralimibaculum aggregatum]|uniref:IstB-like ATP-binding domain-containing protein n=1 Tax=Paralimibaculum aggregatum TaxID=3036245 RepID=A0ABQ6LTG2_9RHOB|nr:hypothetical protein LNKW23_45610 [Limibaculum sp. NKW23]
MKAGVTKAYIYELRVNRTYADLAAPYDTAIIRPGQKACRGGKSVLYHRLPRLFAELELAHGDGRFPRLFRQLTKADPLILDDWGPRPPHRRPAPGSDGGCRGPLSGGLHGHHQPAPGRRLARGGREPTFADAILDRLIHNAHRLPLNGPSLRKTRDAGVSEDDERTLQTPRHARRSISVMGVRCQIFWALKQAFAAEAPDSNVFEYAAACYLSKRRSLKVLSLMRLLSSRMAGPHP